MSSILKALKKLEEEQAGRSASSSAGSGGQAVPSTYVGRPLLLLIGGMGVGLLLAGGLYFWLGGSRESQIPPAPVALEQKPAGITEPAAPGACLVVAEPSSAKVMTAPLPPVAAVTVPAVKAKVVAAPQAAEKAATVAAATTVAVETAPPPAPSLPSKDVAEPPKAPVEQIQIKSHDIPAPGQQWAAPHLTVSDILPASGGGRMAIVNGLPVMEGTMVEDAVVKEIRPEQVVFEVDGKSVVVPLSSAR